MTGTITLHVHGLMVGCGQQNALVQQKLFTWLSNASGPPPCPLKMIVNLEHFFWSDLAQFGPRCSII